MHVKTLMPLGVYLFPINQIKEEMDEKADRQLWKCSNVYARTDKISAFRIEKKNKIMKNEIFAGM